MKFCVKTRQIAMQVKTEFLDSLFFEQHYIKASPPAALSDFVEFYWQTNYTTTSSFSVRTFPRLGSTILINLGSAFGFQKNAHSLHIDDDVYYTRDQVITTTHTSSNCMFGVQLKINLPLIIQRLMPEAIMHAGTFLPLRAIKLMREATTMEDRISLMNEVLLMMLDEKIEVKAKVINKVLNHYALNMDSKYTAKDWEDLTCCSAKTLERYFKECLHLTPKQSLKLSRTRNAIHAFAKQQKRLDYFSLGYYDHSHFHKEIKSLKIHSHI